MSGTINHPSIDPTRRRPAWRLLAVLVTALLLSVLGAGAAGAQSQPGADQGAPVINPQARAADLAQPAIVWIRVHFDAWVVTDWGPIYAPVDLGCSGFVVNPDGYIVSAGHCFDPGMDGASGEAIAQVADKLVRQGVVPESARDRLIRDVMVGAIDWPVEGRYNHSVPDRTVYVKVGGGEVKWTGKPNGNGAKSARVVQSLNWDQGDVALLKLERTGLPSILLSTTDDIEIGDQLLSIGYPAADADGEESFGLTNRNGQINAERTKGPSNLPFYETSARLTFGMSGGPTVNLEGQVVGLASFKNEDANYIVPASIIQELLTRNGVRNQLGRVDQLYRQGLESFYRHEYSAAIKSFDEVLALVPGQRLAAAKKAKAAELRERFGDPAPPAPPAKQGRSTATLLLGGAAVLVVLLVTTAGLVRYRRPRRSRRQAPAAPAADLQPQTSQVWDRAEEAVPVSGGDGEDLDLSRIGYVDHGAGDGARTATSVSVRESEPRTVRNFCSNCGSRVQPDDSSCGQCGARLD
jgi:serine protease Do